MLVAPGIALPWIRLLSELGAVGNAIAIGIALGTVSAVPGPRIEPCFYLPQVRQPIAVAVGLAAIRAICQFVGVTQPVTIAVNERP